MQQLFLLLITISIFSACKPTNNKDAKMRINQTVPSYIAEQPASQTSVSRSEHRDEYSFTSEGYTTSDLKKDTSFEVNVRYNKKSFTAPIQFFLDGENTTGKIYKDIKTRDQDDLDIWVDAKNIVTSIYMRDPKNSTGEPRGTLLIYEKGKYPVKTTSGD